MPDFPPCPGSIFYEDECRDLIRKHFHAELSGLGIADLSAGVIAAGAVLRYVYDTQFSTVSYITGIRIYNLSEHMILDSSTLRNLELLETLRKRKRREPPLCAGSHQDGHGRQAHAQDHI